MAKLLIIDDTAYYKPFKDYIPYFEGNEVHHALYLDTVYPKSEIERVLEEGTQIFIDEYGLASSTPYFHEELVEFLQREGDQFDKIILDGLAKKCFNLIEEVPLSSAKIEVFSGRPEIIEECKTKNIPCRSKKPFSQ